MFPLLTLNIRADNELGRVPAFDPLDQTQQDAVIGLVDAVRGDTT